MITLLATFLLSPLTIAQQHQMHGMSGDDDLHVMTMPDNDEVLVAAPQSIVLHFASAVRLVKLSLKDPSQGKTFIDIGFRYRPEAGMHFEQALPVLAAADYYAAEWAALDSDGKLHKGTFYFSFGPEAQPASSYQHEMEHSMPPMSPDYRLLQ